MTQGMCEIQGPISFFFFPISDLLKNTIQGRTVGMWMLLSALEESHH